MKKEKRIIIITISIMAFILTCIMFMQFKVVNQTDIAQIESMREDELEKVATEWKEKQQEAFKKLTEINQKIQEYDTTIENNEEARELIEKELAEAKRNFGLTDVTGEGIEIILTDTEEKSYDANDLLELVNELRGAGAEAISINGERVTNITDIVNISTRYIMMNGEKISSPYVIKVIGDKRYLTSALTIKNGYFDIKQKGNYDIHIQEKSNLKIEKYTNEITLKYIEL